MPRAFPSLRVFPVSRFPDMYTRDSEIFFPKSRPEIDPTGEKNRPLLLRASLIPLGRIVVDRYRTVARFRVAYAIDGTTTTTVRHRAARGEGGEGVRNLSHYRHGVNIHEDDTEKRDPRDLRARSKERVSKTNASSTSTSAGLSGAFSRGRRRGQEAAARVKCQRSLLMINAT